MKKAFYHSIIIALLSIVLNFSFKVFVANLIDKATLALYFTAIDILTLTLLILVGFRSSMVVSFMRTKNDVAIINIFRVVILVAVLLAWAFIIPFLKHKVGITIDYWYLVASVISMGVGIYLSNQIAMYRLYSIINRVTFLEPFLLIIWFLIAFYISGVHGMQALFIATIMSSISLSLYIYFQRMKEIPTVSLLKPELSSDMKLFIKNSLISTIEFGSGMMLMYVAVLLMMRYFSVEELGDFQVVTKPIFMYMITLFVFPIFRFVLPELSKLVAEKDVVAIIDIKRWMIKYAFIVSGGFLIVTLLFSKTIVLFFFGENYENAYIMIVHLAFFFIFVVLNAYQLSFIKANGAFFPALLIRLSGIGSLLILFFSIYYLYEKSVIAIIVSLVGSYSVMFVMSLVVEQRLMRGLKSQ